MHLEELINVVKERRKILKINQEELSELTDVGLRTIKGIESGEGNPTLKTISKILDVLGMEFTVKTKK